MKSEVGIMTNKTSFALKEWASAVQALEEGKTIMLLRKGGIREEGKNFTVAHDSILLYPTYEHQKPNLLKPQYSRQVTPVKSGWHPETVTIGSTAKITNISLVTKTSTLEALFPYHIWNEEFASVRFQWKPRQPLYVLLLRTYRLPEPVMIPYHQSYGGCKSWIDLVVPISLENIVPVLDETEYSQRVEEILALVNRE